MDSTELKPLMGVWGQSPSGPLLGVSRGKAPLKLKAFHPFSYKREAKR